MARANPRLPISASACPARAKLRAAPCTSTARSSPLLKAPTMNFLPHFRPSSTITWPPNIPSATPPCLHPLGPQPLPPRSHLGALWPSVAVRASTSFPAERDGDPRLPREIFHFGRLAR